MPPATPCDDDQQRSRSGSADGNRRSSCAGHHDWMSGNLDRRRTCVDARGSQRVCYERGKGETRKRCGADRRPPALGASGASQSPASESEIWGSDLAPGHRRLDEPRFHNGGRSGCDAPRLLRAWNRYRAGRIIAARGAGDGHDAKRARKLDEDPCQGRLLFAAKEAVYKAVYPLDQLFLDHHDVEVSLTDQRAVVCNGRVVELRFGVSEYLLALAFLRGAGDVMAAL